MRALIGRATAEELATVAGWRSAAPEHAQRYLELEQLLKRTSAWYDSSVVLPAPAAADLMRRATARSKVVPLPAGRPRAWWRRGLIAAAAVVLVVLSIRARSGMRTRSDSRAMLGALDVRNTDTTSKTFTLNDGTIVILAPSSHLRIEPRDGARDVSLDGRAEFTVTHMADRPFRVRTSLAEVQDLGTHFVVRADESIIRVAVFEGRVAIAGNGASIQLAAGDVGSVVGGNSPTLARHGNRRSSDDWLRAGMILDGATLNDVAVELRHRYGYRVIVADTGIGRHTINAWFKTTPTAPDALTAICRVLGARCRITDSLAVVSSPLP